MFQISNVGFFFFFPASVRPRITGEQEDFIRRVTEIPFDERKCRDLITLDTLYTYCGGPEPTLEARRLNAYSCRHKFICFSHSFFFSHQLVQGRHLFQYSSFVFAKMEAAKQRVKEAAPVRKRKRGKLRRGSPR